MKQKCKKLLSVFLSITMLFSITAGIDFSAYALASSGKCGYNATWSFDESTGTLTISGTGDMYDYDDDLFERSFYFSSIKSVKIENGITSIGKCAFEDCTSLTSVTIPDSVTSIGDWGFCDCTNLTSITIPNSVTSIGDYAFGDCSSLTSVTIPNSVTNIGDGAFQYCSSLTSITIPNSVTSIGYCAFRNCSSLTSVTIPNSVTSIGEDAFAYCRSLTSITIPNSVTSIGNSAFEGCTSLTSITIPNSVTSIGNGAFEDCTSLRSVTIPNSVTSIGNGAFEYCTSLTSVTIPNSVTSIGYLAFYRCTSLTSVTIPNSVTSIGESTFSGCSSLRGVTIPNSVTSIGNYAFYYCESLTSVTIPNSVTSIGDWAFDSCSSLTSVTIPNSVTSIGFDTFFGCKSLTNITIPNSVTNIEESAFNNCPSLTDVYYLGSEQEWNNISIGDSNSYLVNAKIHYNSISPCDVHTPLNAVKENVKKATCTTVGSYDSVVYCSVCKREISRSKKTISKLSHNYKTTTTKATTSADGKIVKKCSVCGKVASTTVIPKASSVKLSATSYTYDGKVKTPSVTVKDSKGKTLKRNTDYTVTYSSGRKNVGKYAVKVTLKGNYAGTKTLYFNINPKGTTIAKLTPKSKSFTVQWNKQTNQTTGYQIQYSVYSNFSGAKTITMPKNTYYAKSITGLAGNKRYYVRIRTYKTVKFNGKNYNLYSPWSSAKYTTTKR